jgi:hypothetical protein
MQSGDEGMKIERRAQLEAEYTRELLVEACQKVGVKTRRARQHDLQVSDVASILIRIVVGKACTLVVS